MVLLTTITSPVIGTLPSIAIAGTLADRCTAELATSTSPSIALPSSLTSLVICTPELAIADLSAAALMVPDRAILRWNDLMSDPQLITEVMIEFGSFWLAPAAPLEPAPGALVALPLEHAAAATSTKPARTANADLLTRIKMNSSQARLCSIG